ncbi:MULTISPECIES: serine/threonine-protein kinase [unclassified Streptomyces]|uniref:serine/threonine-protein kinase n=1 Tax=unclassified Streptomyces TaxID=2593676 RepID=UPI00074A6BEA|nr:MULTISPECIES: serine/threonine-protein kinase [unclassified Streptomyces]KUL77623.1 serine/threonine protein kinase [Streptomyces sp. NRRL WC-3605]KUL78745.1 serine/threonine protein kinase [Streptomyces sp. NRRL WC-3604]
MGEVFAGRYELVDPIGRGGVGAVWRAWDHRRRRYVAAKVLQQSDAHSLLRFVREQALRIDHPHVLAPASWAADDDKVLFTMDLVGGGSLVHLVGDYGPLPPPFVCTLLDQLLSGLAAVHAEGVVHRDIKPANVLLEATGTARPRLRLSDFGIAMRLGEARLTETNLVVGTPGYLAPEQLLGSDPDFPADLFAVGLVALYLLEGAKPDAKALVQYFTEHGTPGPPKGIPEPLWQIVATLLQPDPHARFRTATGARKALASAAELLPEPGPDDELIEIFDQLGPLPSGFGPEGPQTRAPGVIDGTGTTSTALRADRAGTAGADSSASLTGDQPPSVPPHPMPLPPVPSIPAPPAVAPPVPSASPAPPPHRPEAPQQGTRTPPDSSPSGHRLPTMSDTGSFPLPPPDSTASTAGATAPPPPYDRTRDLAAHRSPVPQYPYGPPAPAEPPTPTPSPAPAPYHRVDASTASYTAQSPQVPFSPPPGAQSPPPGAPSRPRAGHRAVRRPGPPAKVAIPLLLLALACYAVGFWALSRI